MTLVEVTSPTRTANGYELTVAPGWQQGRGAYGGLCVASLVRALEERIADPARKLRSLTAELPGPVNAGSADITVDILRAGNSVTTARASLAQRGEVKTHAVGVFAASRRSAAGLAWQELAPPQAPPWNALMPMPPTSSTGPFGPPEFTQHFEYRVVEGIPLSGKPAVTLGWVRAREPGALRDAAFLAAMIDAWWPAAMVRMPTIRPFATITYTLELLGDLAGLDPDAPLLYRGTVPVFGDGYFLETRELWGEDGRLLARNHQTFAVIA
ncbi:MAG: thioesterase family protein [Kofleriaceae bacterium]|nr:thioesterase family protein [Kofleriaceae bacterium]